jgi:hypothetical protein
MQSIRKYSKAAIEKITGAIKAIETPIGLIKDAAETTADLTKMLTETAWNPTEELVTWITGLPSDLGIASFAFGTFTPIAFTAAVVCDLTELETLNQALLTKFFLRFSLYVSIDGNASKLGLTESNPTVVFAKAFVKQSFSESVSLLDSSIARQEREAIFTKYETDATIYLKSNTTIEKDFYQYAITQLKALNQNTIEIIFQATDAEQDRRNSKIKLDKQRSDLFRKLFTFPFELPKKVLAFIADGVKIITGKAFNPADNFIALITGLPNELGLGSLALGVASPIIATADLVYDLAEFNAINQEYLTKFFLRFSLYVADETNRNHLGLDENNVFVKLSKEFPEAQSLFDISLSPKEREKIFIRYENEATAYLNANKSTEDSFYTAAKAQFKLLDNQTIEAIFETTDAESNRQNFNTKFRRQEVDTIKTAWFCVFGWLTLSLDILKFSAGLSLTTATAIPYIAITAFAFSYVGSIATIIFSAIKFIRIIKDYTDMLNGLDDKDDKHQVLQAKLGNKLGFIDKATLFVTEKFLLDSFLTVCGAGIILATLLLLAGIASTPIGEIAVASLSAAAVTAEIFDYIIRKVVTKYTEHQKAKQQIIAPKGTLQTIAPLPEYQASSSQSPLPKINPQLAPHQQPHLPTSSVSLTR